MSDRYLRMADRAAPFQETANWISIGIACAALYFGAMIVLTAAFSFWAMLPRIIENPQVMNDFLMGSTVSAVRWNLAVSGDYLVVLWAILKTMHQKTLAVLLGPPAAAVRSFGRVGLYLIPLYGILLVPALDDPEVYQQFDLTRWMLLLPTTLPLLFVQIGTEEAVFRGYLQSHLAALSKSPLVWLLIPSILFGLIHYDGSQPANSAWIYVLWAVGLGLVCADVTARCGNLGPALAIHFVNNIVAILVMASDDWLFGASLFVWQTFGQPWQPWVPFEALFLCSVWLAARLAIRR